MPSEPSAWLSLGCPAATFTSKGHVVTYPRGSALGPIPRPAREILSHRAVGGCDHIRIRRSWPSSTSFFPNRRGGSTAALPKPSRTPHSSAGGSCRSQGAPPGKAEGTWHWWRAQCQAGFTLSTPAVQHTCLFLPAQGLPLSAEM